MPAADLIIPGNCMLQYHIYPEGLRRIVTFSFDDGFENDVRLIKLFDKYNVKATFHLNGNRYIQMTDDELENVRKEYMNHEIACHTFSHGWPTRMPTASLVEEIMKDRKILEKIAGYPVTGMSYPSGSYNGDVTAVMRACGIEYSRTTVETNDFDFPESFLKWHPTCHFKSAKPCAERFMSGLESKWTKPLLYIWGHSHEMQSEEGWDRFEELLKSVAGDDRIWYATNIEIYNYIAAQKSLKISADENVFYNPTAIDVWLEKDKSLIIKIPAGETVRI